MEPIWCTALVALLPLETVRPSGGNGFAAAIVPAIVVVGILILFARWVSSKPKNRRRR